LKECNIYICIYIFNHFKIVPDEVREEKSSGSITGMVRLTSEGTAYFENLDVVGREAFYIKLRQELANAIPVNPERITTNGNFETDTLVSPKQVRLSINIKKDASKQELSVASAVKDLDTLIRYKPFTIIAFGESTKYLDQAFGYKTSCKKSFIIFINCQLKIYFPKNLWILINILNL